MVKNRRVVSWSRKWAAELRALTPGVGLRVGEDEEIGHLIQGEREAAGEADRCAGDFRNLVFHLVPQLLPFRHRAQQNDPGPQPHLLRQRAWPLVSRLHAYGATWPVEQIQLGVDGHTSPMRDTQVVVGGASEVEEGAGCGYHVGQGGMESPSPATSEL